MLGRRGYPTYLCIGVTKEGDELRAHAWIECNGVAVIEAKGNFSTILTLPGVLS